MRATLELMLHHPLFGLFSTVAIYLFSNSIWRRFGGSACLHPVLVTTVVVASLLVWTGFGYDAYRQHTYVLTEALGVVIVLLAVPLMHHTQLIAESGRFLIASLALGSCVAIASAVFLPVALGTSDDILVTLAAKSVTTAVAVEISNTLGGVSGLTAVVVISTGIFGAVCGPAILNAVGVEDDRARGFALGVASHALGTARAFQISHVAGVFASIGMILNALLTIALVPVTMTLIHAW